MSKLLDKILSDDPLFNYDFKVSFDLENAAIMLGLIVLCAVIILVIVRLSAPRFQYVKLIN